LSTPIITKALDSYALFISTADKYLHVLAAALVLEGIGVGFAFEVKEVLAQEFGEKQAAVGNVKDDRPFATAEHGTFERVRVFVVVLVMMGGLGFLGHGVLSVCVHHPATGAGGDNAMDRVVSTWEKISCLGISHAPAATRIAIGQKWHPGLRLCPRHRGLLSVRGLGKRKRRYSDSVCRAVRHHSSVDIHRVPFSSKSLRSPSARGQQSIFSSQRVPSVHGWNDLSQRGPAVLSQ